MSSCLCLSRRNPAVYSEELALLSETARPQGGANFPKTPPQTLGLGPQPSGRLSFGVLLGRLGNAGRFFSALRGARGPRGASWLGCAGRPPEPPEVASGLCVRQRRGGGIK